MVKQKQKKKVFEEPVDTRPIQDNPYPVRPQVNKSDLISRAVAGLRLAILELDTAGVKSPNVVLDSIKGIVSDAEKEGWI